MKKEYRVASTSLLVLSLIAGGFILFDSREGRQDNRINADESEFNTTPDGARYTVPPSELITGCSGIDCIPSIDDPAFQSAEEASWLKDEDLVMGVEINGETKAYPLRILNLHEIVNDEVGGEPIAVTYCPLCRSGLTYSREIQNRTLEFGVSGKLHNANLIMYDRQTETYWSQIQGEAVVGPMVPAELQLVFSEIVEWGNWTEKHPDTQVLSRNTGVYPASSYGSSPYEGYDQSERVGFGVDEVDDRLSSKELVYGVNVGGSSKAYTEETVKREDIIEDEVGGVPVLVLEDQQSGAVKIFSREVEEQTLDFSLEDGQLVDQSGGRWRLDGGEVSGSRELDRLNSHGFFWFAWSSFNPDTEIYSG